LLQYFRVAHRAEHGVPIVRSFSGVR
jgi:hypothetical protein